MEGKKRAAVHGRPVEGMLEQEVTKGKDTASQGPGQGVQQQETNSTQKKVNSIDEKSKKKQEPSSQTCRRARSPESEGQDCSDTAADAMTWPVAFKVARTEVLRQHCATKQEGGPVCPGDSVSKIGIQF